MRLARTDRLVLDILLGGLLLGAGLSASIARLVFGAYSIDIWGVLLIAAFVHGTLMWHGRTRSIFDPFYLLFVSLFVFHAGEAVLMVFGLDPDGFMLRGIFSGKLVALSLEISFYCLYAYAIGGALTARPFPMIESSRWVPPAHVGAALVAVSAPYLAAELLTNLTLVVQGGYHAAYAEREFSTGFGAYGRVLSRFFVPGLLFLFAGLYRSRAAIHAIGAVVAFYAIVRFAAGERADGALAILSYAWLWHRLVRPIPKRWLLGGGAVLLFVVFPAIQTIRQQPLVGQRSLGGLLEVFASPTVSILETLGLTLRTVAYTLELMATRGYDYGLGYLNALGAVVPNFWGDLHFAASRKYMIWLLEEVAPKVLERGAGFGFSAIAEAYINFGWFAPLFFVMLGFGLARWTVRCRSLVNIAVLTSFMHFLLMFARGESLGVIRNLIWYCLLPGAGALMLALLYRSFRAQSESDAKA